MTTTTSIERETYYLDVNGISLHVVQAGPKDGELVILLHGFPEFWYGWHAQIDALAAAGYRVWVPDQRGYNLSDKPKAVEAYRMKHLVADVIGLINASGREKVYLVGHDWGGGVAWSTAIRHPERLKKLAILNTPHPQVFVDQLKSNPRQALRSTYMAFFQTPVIPETLMLAGDGAGAARLLNMVSAPGTFNDKDIAHYLKAWKRPGAMTAMLNWYRAAGRNPGSVSSVRSDLTNAPRDNRVHVPTLILWGTNDVALGMEMAQPSADMCDEAQLITFDAGHFIQHERPDAINEHLIAWMR